MRRRLALLLLRRSAFCWMRAQRAFVRGGSPRLSSRARRELQESSFQPSVVPKKDTIIAPARCKYGLRSRDKWPSRAIKTAAVMIVLISELHPIQFDDALAPLN